MKKYLFLLACFGLLMAQCHKETPLQTAAIVKGKILEIDSDVPIPNAAVSLIDVDPSGSFWNPKRTTVQKMTSDASGNYQFSFDWLNGHACEVEAQAAADKFYFNTTTAIFSSNSGQNVQNVYITPFAWTMVHIKNISPFDDRDEIKCYYGTYYGRKIDTLILMKDYGNIKKGRSVKIRMTKNGIETFKDIEVPLPPHDTTKLDIFY
jgi:hypothetical protein